MIIAEAHRENHNLRESLCAAALRLNAPPIVPAEELMFTLAEIALDLDRIVDAQVLSGALLNNINFVTERLHDAIGSIPTKLVGDSDRWAQRMMKMEKRVELAREILAGKEDDK